MAPDEDRPVQRPAAAGTAVGGLPRGVRGVRPQAVAGAAVLRRRNPVRVCIVYEHSLFAHGIKQMLKQQPALRTIGLLERPTVSARSLRRLRPDVVIVEGDEGMALLECLEGLTAMAISLRGAEATIFTGLPVRVSGPEQLAEAIHRVARGRTRRRVHKVTR